MPVMQPPTGPIEVSDPNNVPETFVNGPFNIVKGGGLVHLTFTTIDVRTSGHAGALSTRKLAIV
jgi:hypothetical protein